MTRQVLDTISIDGRHHWLAKLAPILPPGHAERIGLEFERESTANYRGWRTHWTIKDGRLFLAELTAFGHLRSDKPTKRFEEITDKEELKAWRRRYVEPRHISPEEIFGSDPPIFASWVCTKLVTVCGVDDTQYRRDDFGVTGPHTRIIGVENGLVVSDETIANPAWNPDRSEHHRRQAERARAMRAAEEFKRRRNVGPESPE